MNLFVVATPLQLLNATEACHYFKLADNHLIIVTDNSYVDHPYPWNRLVNSAEWAKVYYLTLENVLNPGSNWEKYNWRLRRYRNRSRVDALANQYRHVDHLVLGNYLPGFNRHFANRIAYRALCLVDDGTDALYLDHLRRTNVACNGATARPHALSVGWRSLKTQFRTRLLAWDSRPADKVIFFTAYNVTGGPEDKIVKNDYFHCRAILRGRQTDERCLFLGQCLVRDGYVTESVYLRYLADVQAHFVQQGRIIYIPHPREEDQLVKRISEQFDFSVEPQERPIEYQLMYDNTRPKIIASFFCSALVSCRSLFGSAIRLKAFHIQDSDIQRWPELVESAYRYYETLTDPAIEIVEAL